MTVVETVSMFRVSLVKEKTVALYKRSIITNSAIAANFFRAFISSYGQTDREQFCVALLDVKNSVIGVSIVATGGLMSTAISPREVMRVALLANAASIVCCHNHPSGDCTPSKDDFSATKKIVSAANVMDIIVHEHLIISSFDKNYYSFSDHGHIIDNQTTY